MNQNVEKAVHLLWADPNCMDGTEARALLEEAVNEGDADACYFLGRTYLGDEFVAPRFGFAYEKKKGIDLFVKSTELGSAIGMFGVLRIGHMFPGNPLKAPYSSYQELWDAVLALAQDGEVFCQYMMANAMYYGDYIKMFNIPKESVTAELLQENQMKALDLYEKVLEQGMTMGVGNMVDIVSSGDYGIPKDEAKRMEYVKKAAELHHAWSECELGRLSKNGEEAKMYLERALQHGSTNANLFLGKLYTYNGLLPRDLAKAKGYFEKGIELNAGNKSSCMEWVTEIYFNGGDGVNCDYSRAFEMLNKIKANGSKFGSHMLGHMYLKGLATEVDYAKAKEWFEKCKKGIELSDLGLGEIYAYGLGVTQDCNKGIKEYILPHKETERAQQILKDFKKGLFGWKPLAK